jgi:hypothetical protein
VAPRPRIYVYELPPQFSAWYDVKQTAEPLEAVFWERLMSSAHRVAEPAEADYFFLPVPAQVGSHHPRYTVLTLT